MAVTVNIGELNKRIGRSSVSKTLIRSIIQPKLDRKKKQLIRDFNQHLITKEIDAGPTSNNKSGTLDGYGNLFSFIGFNQGDRPADDVRKFLNRAAVGKIRKVNYIGLNRYQVIINTPDKQALFDQTPIPWGSGRSWLDGIEHGLAGFGQYIYDKKGRFDKWSFSGTAIQLKNTIRGGGLRGSKYITQMLMDYEHSLRKL